MYGSGDKFDLSFKVDAFSDEGDTELGEAVMRLAGMLPEEPPALGGFTLSQKCGSFEMTVDEDNIVLTYFMRMIPGARGMWAELYNWNSDEVIGYLYSSDDVWGARPGDLLYFEFRSGYDYWHELSLDQAALSPNTAPIGPVKIPLFPLVPPCPYGVTHMGTKEQKLVNVSQLSEAVEGLHSEVQDELTAKQDRLTAGSGIAIVGSTISATSGTWTPVPANKVKALFNTVKASSDPYSGLYYVTSVKEECIVYMFTTDGTTYEPIGAIPLYPGQPIGTGGHEVSVPYVVKPEKIKSAGDQQYSPYCVGVHGLHSLSFLNSTPQLTQYRKWYFVKDGQFIETAYGGGSVTTTLLEAWPSAVGHSTEYTSAAFLFLRKQ